MHCRAHSAGCEASRPASTCAMRLDCVAAPAHRSRSWHASCRAPPISLCSATSPLCPPVWHHWLSVPDCCGSSVLWCSGCHVGKVHLSCDLHVALTLPPLHVLAPVSCPSRSLCSAWINVGMCEPESVRSPITVVRLCHHWPALPPDVSAAPPETHRQAWSDMILLNEFALHFVVPTPMLEQGQKPQHSQAPPPPPEGSATINPKLNAQPVARYARARSENPPCAGSCPIPGGSAALKSMIKIQSVVPIPMLEHDGFARVSEGAEPNMCRHTPTTQGICYHKP